MVLVVVVVVRRRTILSFGFGISFGFGFEVVVVVFGVVVVVVVAAVVVVTAVVALARTMTDTVLAAAPLIASVVAKSFGWTCARVPGWPSIVTTAVGATLMPQIVPPLSLRVSESAPPR